MSLKHAVIRTADFFLPRLCAGCDRKLLPHYNIICPECSNSLALMHPSILKTYYEELFSDWYCREFFSLYLFTDDSPVRNIIHKLKYSGQRNTGPWLGSILKKRIAEISPGFKADIIVPTPIHNVKKIERGYNQSMEIARAFTERGDALVSDELIKKMRQTESQTHKNFEERRENIRNTFGITKRGLELIPDKNILIVDDVITTGATTRELISVLSEAGAASVSVATVAVTE